MNSTHLATWQIVALVGAPSAAAIAAAASWASVLQTRKEAREGRVPFLAVQKTVDRDGYLHLRIVNVSASMARGTGFAVVCHRDVVHGIISDGFLGPGERVTVKTPFQVSATEAGTAGIEGLAICRDRFRGSHIFNTDERYVPVRGPWPFRKPRNAGTATDILRLGLPAIPEPDQLRVRDALSVTRA